MVTLSAVKAMVTDFDCGELIADCIRLILLSFIVFYLNFIIISRLNLKFKDLKIIHKITKFMR